MAKEEPPLADEPRVGGEALGFLLLLLLLLLLSSPDVARGARAGGRFLPVGQCAIPRQSCGLTRLPRERSR